jgi:5'-nucleotidase/UDP-sugar diphosphatase
VSGIDVIVDAHSHTLTDEPIVVGNTRIVAAGEDGKYLGQGLASFSGKSFSAFQWTAVAIGADQAVTAMLAPYQEEAEASLSQVIGTAGGDFPYGDNTLGLSVRQGEAALGDLVCDGTVWYIEEVFGQDIDFAFHNGGNVRVEIPAGPITSGDILTLLPYSNSLFIASLSGEKIIELFQFIASVERGDGAFAQVSSGVRYTIDYSGGTGKLDNLTIGGQAIDPAKTYRFCTNDYLIGGGDGYTVLTEATDLVDTSLLLSYVVTEYIRGAGFASNQAGLIQPVLDGRITIKGK